MTCLARHLLSLSLLVTSVSGKSYRWFCDISVYPLTDLVQDPSFGAIHVYKGGRVLERQSTLRSNDVDEVLPEGRRHLERHSSLRSNVDDSWSSAVHVQRLEDVFVDKSRMIHFTGRECWCANNDPIAYGDSFYYCTTPYTHCAIPSLVSNIDVTPGCINRSKTELFAKAAWPVIIVWFAVLFSCICCTKVGHQVHDYVIGMLFPGWNVWVRDRILRHDPDRANRLIRHYWRRRRIALEARYLQIITQLRESDQGGAVHRQEMENIVQDIAPPNELALKTRIFYRSTKAMAVKAEDLEDDDSEFDDETTCTICFAPLDDGDRVGALACDHIFHVECLKRWLVRRNTCPLCQMQNAATPRYTPRVQETDVTPTDVATNGVESEGRASEPERANEPLTPITQEMPAVPAWQDALRAINRRQRGSDIN